MKLLDWNVRLWPCRKVTENVKTLPSVSKKLIQFQICTSPHTEQVLGKLGDFTIHCLAVSRGCIREGLNGIICYWYWQSVPREFFAKLNTVNRFSWSFNHSSLSLLFPFPPGCNVLNIGFLVARCHCQVVRTVLHLSIPLGRHSIEGVVWPELPAPVSCIQRPLRMHASSFLGSWME